MDLNQLLHDHQLSLMRLDRSANDEERRAHSQFVHDYAVRIRMIQNDLGAADAVCEFRK